jgi:hypothetical protein
MSNISAGLKKGLEKAAGHRPETPVVAASLTMKATTKTVLIGAHYPPEVRRALLLVQADPKNEGRNLKQLLGEAINDLCAKYGQPEPYTGEA